MSIALDEQKEDDMLVEESGFKFIIDSELASSMGALDIDYSSKWYSKGFVISASNFGSGSC